MSAPSSAYGADATPTAVPPHCLIGNCTVALRHATTYEPPLYLFPELLPRVPQGTPPVTAWDAVADAIDVTESSWRLAEYSPRAVQNGVTPRTASAPVSGDAPGEGNRSAGSKNATRSPLHTLAAMLGANRLLPVGLTADALAEGQFSAAGMIAELEKLQQRLGLVTTDTESAGGTTEDRAAESAVVMSNHFVNLVAWQKLREINDSTPSASTSTPVHRDSSIPDGPSTQGTTDKQRNDAGDILTHLKASPDPWSSTIDEQRFAGVFVSGREEDADQKVALLNTLSSLYGQPWKRMASQGIQTDHVVPPGSVNVTSPYANPHHPSAHGKTGAATSPATLRTREDLGWEAEAPQLSADSAFRVTISSLASDAAAQVQSGHSRSVLLTKPTTYFGRFDGTQSDPRVGSVMVDVGLAPWCQGETATVATFLSCVHFALQLVPTFRSPADAEGSLTDIGGVHDGGSADDSDTDGEPQRKRARLHRKTPTGHTLMLLNYGRNGVCVRQPKTEGTISTRWVHGDPVQLNAGDEIVIEKAVVVRVLSAADDAASSATHVKQETTHGEDVGSSNENAPASSGLSQVKLERDDS